MINRLGLEQKTAIGSYTLGQFAGFFRWVGNLIVEDRVVKSKAEADGMGSWHFVFADIKGILVGVFWVGDNT